MKDEGGRMKARLSAFCFHFLLHPSAFILSFECSRHAVNLEDERDVGDFAALALADEVEEDGGGGAVAVPDVALRHALAERVACGLGCRGRVEDLHFVLGGEVFRVHPFTLAPYGKLTCAPSAEGRARRGRVRGGVARRASGGFRVRLLLLLTASSLVLLRQR